MARNMFNQIELMGISFFGGFKWIGHEILILYCESGGSIKNQNKIWYNVGVIGDGQTGGGPVGPTGGSGFQWDPFPLGDFMGWWRGSPYALTPCYTWHQLIHTRHFHYLPCWTEEGRSLSLQFVIDPYHLAQIKTSEIQSWLPLTSFVMRVGTSTSRALHSTLYFPLPSFYFLTCQTEKRGLKS